MNPQDQTQVNQGNPQQQVIERLKTAVNVLVTVSNSPTVDQLASAVGFTLALNKMGKHATAVYSGDTPSTIEFLKPEATIEKNTDSLRDFIVSLDKSKADKLRYKVEDNVVKIFITPFRTSLSEKDLDFSQGDFNVDAVVALGVSEREQLDQAIVAHGRILHDATVLTISAGEISSSLGAINWQDPGASSLSEMLVSVGEALQPGLLDNQIATAYLTGIVAQTERFRNNKTTPKIMTMSAQLMAAGANQQLIASSLEAKVEVPIKPEPETQAEPAEPEKQEAPEEPAATDSVDGTLNIDHEEPPQKIDLSKESGLNLDISVEPEAEEDEDKTSQISIDEHGTLSPYEEKQMPADLRHRLVEPMQATPPVDNSPTFAGGPHPLTGLGSDDGENEPITDPLSGKMPEIPTSSQPAMLDHDKIGPGQQSAVSDSQNQPSNAVLPPLPSLNDSASTSILPPVAINDPYADPAGPTIASNTSLGVSAPDNVQTIPPFMDDNTLRDIEKTFDSNHIVRDPTSTINEIEEVEHSPHIAQAEVVDSARDAVMSAINAAPYDENRPQPLQSLNAMPIDTGQPAADPVLAQLGQTNQVDTAVTSDGSSPSATLGSSLTAPSTILVSSPTPLTNDPTGQIPPPVPPPLLPLQ